MKRQQGFTLIEILISMFILTMSVYVLSDLQIHSMFKMMREREQLLKFFMVKNALINQLPEIKQHFKPEKTAPEGNGLSLVVDIVEPEKKSILKDILGKQLVIVKAVGSWKDGTWPRTLEFFSIAQREEEPPRAKKK